MSEGYAVNRLLPSVATLTYFIITRKTQLHSRLLFLPKLTEIKGAPPPCPRSGIRLPAQSDSVTEYNRSSSSKFKVYYSPLQVHVHTNNKEGNTLTDSHIQEQQMHIYRVLSATSTKGAHRDIDHVNPSSRTLCDCEWLSAIWPEEATHLAMSGVDQ